MKQFTEENLTTSSRKSGWKIDKNQIRTHVKKVRFNDEELLFLNKMSAVLNISRAEYVRLCLLETLPKQVPELNMQAWVALSTLSSNLNQIAKKLNQGQAPEIAEIKHHLSKLRETLLGANNG
ncbi:MAG: plasmid mobilization relaxosome protein MobC [Methylotenera sp.]|nr:plasmid mobilization relaxosome protein MobC [Methylotenera sp.]